MSSLTDRDVRAVSLFLQQIHAQSDIKTFGNRILSIVPQLVSSELTIFGSIDYKRREITSISSCPSFSLDSVKKGIYQDFYEHPNLAYVAKTRDCRTYKISDFMTECELHRTESVYQTFLRPLGLEDQMMAILPHHQYSPIGSEGTWQGEETLVISLKRSNRSFSERDRTILNLLRPHLMQAYYNAKQFSQMQENLVELNQALEQSNTLILNRVGQVKLMTSQACRLLDRYFQSSSSQLPDTLQRWVTHQISRFHSSEAIAVTPLPLRVQQADKCLVIRAIPNLAREEFLLLLEEQQVRSFSSIELEFLGLTKREAEVLFWVAKDKTNPEIAALLSCSIGTVKTHLEHIYEKFGIQTRMAAVMYAIEHLGLLDRSFN